MVATMQTLICRCLQAAAVGFLYITNHGIPQVSMRERPCQHACPTFQPWDMQDVIDGAYAANKQACSLPDDVKKLTADEEGQMKQFPWMSKAYTLGWTGQISIKHTWLLDKAPTVLTPSDTGSYCAGRGNKVQPGPWSLCAVLRRPPGRSAISLWTALLCCYIKHLLHRGVSGGQTAPGILCSL